MKKQLLAAAVAATMASVSSVSMADISIKGDAHLEYANIEDGINAAGARVADTSANTSRQRVRLHITGKSGDTTVKLGLRNDGATRVSGGERGNAEAAAEGSGRGASVSAALNVDYLFLTTKIGALNIKAGDWWDSTGLGVARKGRPATDRVEFSTKVGGWKVALETGADSSSTVLSASGKVNGFAIKLEHDTNANASGIGASDAGSYTDVSVKGKVGAVGIAAEYFAGNLDDNADADASVVHLWTKASGVTWHVAYAQTDAGKTTLAGGNSKFSPLGVSILATAPGANGAGAIGNFGNADDTVAGVRADFKLAGMGVQVAAGNLSLANDAIDDSFYDIIVKRSLGKGSSIQFSRGSFNDVDSTAAKVSVKF
ncbi:hypothetical protein SPBRAN_1043 [uncultured Candidatus Thioglobus sp.]|nr:hypothetical protein SPBRAN_1043 [uncultured Candidatus Thioglobus sp.]